MRPPAAQRTYVSPAVDSFIEALVPRFKDPNLATLFSNTLPNSLDTTVYKSSGTSTETFDTFVVTGDIPAMWLRDSTNQVLPYARWLSNDTALQKLFVGLINRQAHSVLIDPYANAYQVDAFQGQGPHSDDSTYTTLYAGTVVSAMTPSIFERKWEVDSLANVLRLSHVYFEAMNGDVTPFNQTWVHAVASILATFRIQQQDTAMDAASGGPVYFFQRTTGEPSDTLEHGVGYPVRYTGMIKGGFRGSDDACVYNYNIPENTFASATLKDISTVLTAVGQTALAAEALAIAADIDQGLLQYGMITHPTAGKVWAYEVRSVHI
jgi:meiotically up-regulated gene 157 (Mug157) protein